MNNVDHPYINLNDNFDKFDCGNEFSILFHYHFADQNLQLD